MWRHLNNGTGYEIQQFRQDENFCRIQAGEHGGVYVRIHKTEEKEEGEREMTAETRVQIEVVKNRDYLGGIYKGTAMITDGRYIVYIPEKDVIINIPKLRNLPEDGMKRFSPEELMAKMKPALITRKALILSSGLVRCFQCGEDGESYIQDKYYKMFKECKPYYVVDDGHKNIVFVRYGVIVGLVLPMRISEEVTK